MATQAASREYGPNLLLKEPGAVRLRRRGRYGGERYDQSDSTIHDFKYCSRTGRALAISDPADGPRYARISKNEASSGSLQSSGRLRRRL